MGSTYPVPSNVGALVQSIPIVVAKERMGMGSELSRWVEERLDADVSITDEAGLLVLAALEGHESLDEYLAGGNEPAKAAKQAGDPAGAQEEEPAGAFLSGLGVQGFRGIGPKVEVDLQPQPGLTIVAGRNGSGKSSLAEALEVALTGSTYRWGRKGSVQWKEQWRNLHEPAPASVEVRVAEEGRGQTTIGLSWEDTATEASSFATWVQRPAEKRQPGLTPLGWDKALQTYRPMMSYDELGGLLEGGPSGLYDALSAALGVEELAAAIKLLDTRAKALKAPEKELTNKRKSLQAEFKEMDDERAKRAGSLLRASAPDPAALRTLATGSQPQDSGPLAWLRSVIDLTGPRGEEVDTAATKLAAAIQGMVDAGVDRLERERRRVELREQALHLHAQLGDMTCPVCNAGELDDRWAESSRQHIAHERIKFAELDRAGQDLDLARRSAHSLVTPRPVALNGSPLDGLADLTRRARDAWDAWSASPSGDAELVTHLRERRGELEEALVALHTAAAAELKARQDLWTPLATRLATFADDCDQWLTQKPLVDEVGAALKWLKTNDVALKNERIAPIDHHARHAWAMLRQESNVDLGSVTLEGTATRRRVSIEASVDGEEAGALTVMSQGELHALALSLFLPRAALPESPFRFIVLDDPVQAMDPAKVDGLVTLLSELAETRQVIVLSHDDRLPAAARRAQVPVRILEVTRGECSQVSVRESEAPARRYLRDAEALVRDKELPDDTLRKVLPGVLRFAVEAAARDRFFASRLSEGGALHDVEALWTAHRLTRERVSLAVFDEVRTDLGSWLSAPYRKKTMGISTSGMHDGLGARANLEDAVYDAKRFVSDVEQGNRS
ncbi:AAA family ATPase [Serinicoccus marinus]|uniref:AAA family ATPase n=1 Tax=Serinicoccus marinus TaxID=247333 RepID=UPI00122E2018|nr:AAA family ATPase [Serinicoccus marinus]